MTPLPSHPSGPSFLVLGNSAVSLDQDVDTNKELVGHGYSNLFAGFTGSVLDHFSFFDRLYIALTPDDRPNYLVYVNTLLYARVLDSFRMFLVPFFIRFYRVGGGTRVCGLSSCCLHGTAATHRYLVHRVHP